MAFQIDTTQHRREQILDAARQLFADKGLHHVTTRQIAAAVGISQPSLYAHFPNRDSITVELCVRAFDTLQARLQAAVAGTGTPAQRLFRLGLDYIGFGLQNEAAYRIAFMADLPNDASGQGNLVLQASVQAFGVLHGLIGEVHGHGQPESDVIAQSTWASLHGMVALLLARPQFPWVDLETLIATHLDQLCAMALPDAAAPAPQSAP